MHRPKPNPVVTPAGRARVRRRGFTLLELLVVTSIIVILVSLLLPALAKIRQQAHMTTTKAQIVSLATVMQSYHGDFNFYPGSL